MFALIRVSTGAETRQTSLRVAQRLHFSVGRTVVGFGFGAIRQYRVEIVEAFREVRLGGVREPEQ